MFCVAIHAERWRAMDKDLHSMPKIKGHVTCLVTFRFIFTANRKIFTHPRRFNWSITCHRFLKILLKHHRSFHSMARSISYRKNISALVSLTFGSHALAVLTFAFFQQIRVDNSDLICLATLQKFSVSNFDSSAVGTPNSMESLRIYIGTSKPLPLKLSHLYYSEYVHSTRKTFHQQQAN